MPAHSMPPPARSVQEVVRDAWRREWLLIGLMSVLVLGAGTFAFVLARHQAPSLPRQFGHAATPIPGCPPAPMSIAAAQHWLPAGITIPAGSQIISAGGDQHGSVISLCSRDPAASIAQQIQREFTQRGWQEHYSNLSTSVISLTFSNDFQVAFVVASDSGDGMTRLDLSVVG